MSAESLEMTVLVHVLRANLTKNVELFGRMDPFAVVEWETASGAKREVARTHTDWNSHMSPRWDHRVPGPVYKSTSSSFGRDAVLHLHVFEADMLPASDELIGSASIGVGALLGEGPRKAAEQFPLCSDVDLLSGPSCDLPLLGPAGDSVGTITIRAQLVPMAAARGGSDYMGCSAAKVDPTTFRGSVRRLSVSGGTAAFYRLELQRPEAGQSATHYIGKDLCHARDEVTFYETLREVRNTPGMGGLGPLLGFTLDYAGILSVPDEDQGTRDLLVLRNLCDGCSSLRLLDLKIGQKTASAGWQGKSRLAALRQSLMDGITNSCCQGFRLEGFDGRPPTLTSMDPLLDVGGASGNGGKVAKKAVRVMLQRMPAAEIFLHFFDLHQAPAGSSELLGPSEAAELLMHEAVHRLAALAAACRRAPAPQKWVGSSVALGFDGGALPVRAAGEASVRASLKCNIFDWGRSELNTLDAHRRLSAKEQQDRQQFWSYYVGGIDRLALEAVRAYHHRFGNAGEWRSVTFTIYDFDSLSDNDFLGRLTVPVRPTPETSAELSDSAEARAVGDTFRGAARLTYSIVWQALPAGSRLKGVWRVQVVRATSLPRRDKLQLRTTSDPFCEVVATSEDGASFRFRQLTGVKVRTLDPDWSETLELPVAARSGEVNAALDQATAGLGSIPSGILAPESAQQSSQAGSLFPMGRWSARAENVEDPVARWRDHLDKVASGAPGVTHEVSNFSVASYTSVSSRDADGDVDIQTSGMTATWSAGRQDSTETESPEPRCIACTTLSSDSPEESGDSPGPCRCM